MVRSQDYRPCALKAYLGANAEYVERVGRKNAILDRRQGEHAAEEREPLHSIVFRSS